MKKLQFTFILFLSIAFSASAQGLLENGQKQLNAGFGFSNFGLPVYVGLDFGVGQNITVGPRVSYRNYSQRFGGTNFNQSLLVIAFNGNYHFNELFELPSEWNVYAGLTVAYYNWSSSDFTNSRSSGVRLEGQIGARYFFTERTAINFEFGGGGATGGIIGITYKL